MLNLDLIYNTVAYEIISFGGHVFCFLAFKVKKILKVSLDLISTNFLYSAMFFLYTFLNLFYFMQMESFILSIILFPTKKNKMGILKHCLDFLSEKNNEISTF